MSFLNIQEARREGAKVVIGLAGVSGSGKTYTALQLAYGLAKGRADKIGFLDTENRRGRLYADVLPKPFSIADFPAPHSPKRYIEAIKQFESSGKDVLIIDSVTHEWEGIGGCQDIANEGSPKVPRWNLAKSEHKAFMNVLLQSSMHIIVCIRAREQVDMKNPRDIKSLGIQPVQEKNFMFEMTASVMMWDQGKAQDVLKCPAALQAIIGRGSDYITAKDGKALRDWIDGAEPVDREIERARATLANVCEQGMKALEAAWNAQTNTVRKALASELEGLKKSAAAYDQQRALASSGDTADETADTANALMKTPAETHFVRPAIKPPQQKRDQSATHTVTAKEASLDDDGNIFPSARPSDSAVGGETLEGDDNDSNLGNVAQ